MAGAGIFDKNVGDTIYAADYNSVQSTANLLLGTGLADSGYGQSVTSVQVSTGNTLTVQDWLNVRSDLLKVRQHQTGADESSGLTLISNLDEVTATITNNYRTFASTCQTNRLAFGSGQTATTDYSTSTRSTAWNGTVSHSITITFNSGDHARAFFNSGGAFQFVASRVGAPNDPGTKNKAWSDMLSDMGTVTFDAYGTTYSGSGAYTNYPKTDQGWYTISTTESTIMVKPAPSGNYNENQYRIKVRKNANDNTATILYFTVEFADSDSGDPPILPLPKDAAPGGVDESVTGTLTSTIKVRRAIGSNVVVAIPSFTATSNL
jgi:hypothetical protein